MEANKMKTHHASVTVEWHFSLPPAFKRSGKLQLLTIGGIATTGEWYGELGEYFAAWSDLMKYDKDQFNAVIDAYRNRHVLNTSECGHTYLPDLPGTFVDTPEDSNEPT
jgi:hypothetical protein